MFKYSGNKKRLVKHLPVPPFGTTRIVEPFAGSLAYSMAYRPRVVVAGEANPLVRELLNWLRQDCTPEALDALAEKRKGFADKVDLTKQGLSSPETTLIRLMTSGVYTGQLSSRAHYSQHRCSFDELKSELPYLRASLLAVEDDYLKTESACLGPDTLAFIDPPYLRSFAHYKSSKDHTKNLDVKQVLDFVQRLKCPVLVTYGEGAAQDLPGLPWQKVITRKVPIIRGGGTKERTEWCAKLNWPT